MTTEEIIKQNKRFLRKYKSFTERCKRFLYKILIRYDVIFIRCSDGRLGQIEKMFGLPYGTSKNFINIGGKFKIGSGFFGKLLLEKVEEIINPFFSFRKACIVVTYHYSSSQEHLGCAGFSCKTDDAIKYGHDFIDQIDRVFCAHNQKVERMLIGVCTDTSSLRIHGVGGLYEDVSNLLDFTMVQKYKTLKKLFGGKKTFWFLFFVLYVSSKNSVNILSWVNKKNTNTLIIEHNEQGIAMGRELDWFKSFNKLLIIGGTYGDHLSHVIETAMKVIVNNTISGVIPRGGKIILLATGAFDSRKTSSEALAREEARVNSDALLKYTFRANPELFSGYDVCVITGITDQYTKKFFIIPYNYEQGLRRAKEKYEKYKKTHRMIV